MGSKAIKLKDKNKNAIYPCPYYPVGSIYMSVNNINPSNFFGGTWEQIEDRFLLACGKSYANGSTGGEAKHTLSIEEMPAHNHTFNYNNKTYTSPMIDTGIADNNWGVHWETANGYRANQAGMNNSGGDKAHNNMPPYLAVYVWKRTA